MKVILHVEDDPNDILFLKRAVKKAEIVNPIQIASDGQQAIDYLQGSGQFGDRNRFPLPSLVLLDLKLPRVMGLDVLRWIRKKFGTDLVVVILSASGEEQDIAAAYGLGANAFLIKPSEAARLEEMVKALKDFWLTHSSLPHEAHAEQPGAGLRRN
jgi:CheY-like chemotaxis protein